MYDLPNFFHEPYVANFVLPELQKNVTISLAMLCYSGLIWTARMNEMSNLGDIT